MHHIICRHELLIYKVGISDVVICKLYLIIKKNTGERHCLKSFMTKVQNIYGS